MHSSTKQIAFVPLRLAATAALIDDGIATGRENIYVTIFRLLALCCVRCAGKKAPILHWIDAIWLLCSRSPSQLPFTAEKDNRRWLIFGKKHQTQFNNVGFDFFCCTIGSEELNRMEQTPASHRWQPLFLGSSGRSASKLIDSRLHSFGNEF